MLFRFSSLPHLFVRALARWAAGERLTDRLPKISHITLFPLGPDRIPLYGSTCHQHVAPISGNPKVFFQILDMSKSTFLLKSVFHGGREIRIHDQRPTVLSTTPVFGV